MTNESRLGLAAAVAGLLALGAPTPGLAQTSVYRSLDAASGKPIRVRVVTNLKRDCSVGSGAEVKVVNPPKNGDVVIRNGKMKTPASFRCPNVETPVQIVTYQSKAKFVGSDEVGLQVKTAEGAVQAINVKLNVAETAGAGQPATQPKNGGDM